MVLLAFKKKPSVIKMLFFFHQQSKDAKNSRLSRVRSLLQLDLRLGEGTGCAIAFPIIESAVAFLNEMASFESAGVRSVKGTAVHLYALCVHLYRKINQNNSKKKKELHIFLRL
jgi:NaMN:DMB phosphoribosyltransferase